MQRVNITGETRAQWPGSFVPTAFKSSARRFANSTTAAIACRGLATRVRSTD